MHLPKFYWMHKHHHHSRATNPWTSLSFSVMERFVLYGGVILIPGIVSQFVPLSFDGYFLYFLANYILNVYGHLNVETVKPRFVNTWLGRFMNTTTYHALHHARYKGHYGLFTQTLDRWHDTRFADYEAVQKAAAEQSTPGETWGVL
jgi:lathosterol oxidase